MRWQPVPTDVFAVATVICRASSGICDIAEMCTGGSDACPADDVEPATTVCRSAAGACDVAETCDGCNEDLCSRYALGVRLYVPRISDGLRR